VSNPFGPQQNGIIQIIIRRGTVAKRLSGMEYEGYINTELLLTFLEAEQRDEVINDRFRGIFRTDQVESYKNGIPFGHLERRPRTWCVEDTVRTSDQIRELLLES
jgi:hypothetical protein